MGDDWVGLFFVKTLVYNDSLLLFLQCSLNPFREQTCLFFKQAYVLYVLVLVHICMKSLFCCFKPSDRKNNPKLKWTSSQ